MAPLCRLPDAERAALVALRQRSDTAAHLLVCDQTRRSSSPTHQLPAAPAVAAIAEPADVLLAAAVTAVSAEVVSGLALDVQCEEPRLSTSAACLDQLLDGGLRRGEVVELSGPPASGKTQARKL